MLTDMDKNAIAAGGGTMWHLVLTILKQNGDTTAKQFTGNGLLDITPYLEFFVGYGWLEQVGRRRLICSAPYTIFLP